MLRAKLWPPISGTISVVGPVFRAFSGTSNRFPGVDSIKCSEFVEEDDETPPELRETTKPNFSRLVITPTSRQMQRESITVFESISDALQRREMYRCPKLFPATSAPTDVTALSANASQFTIVSRNGVLFAEGDSLLEELNDGIPNAEAFHSDVMWLWGVCMAAPVRQLADRRLNVLDLNFKFHNLSNGFLEYDATTQSLTDFWRGAAGKLLRS